MRPANVFLIMELSNSRADARSTMFSHDLRSKCADLDELLPKNMYNCKKSVDNK